MIIQNIKLAVDAVVFGFQTDKLYVLLIQQSFSTKSLVWALPGGLVKDDEPLQNAVIRELYEETNVKLNYLEQLFTFGDNINRDSRNRVVTVAYYGLIDSSKFKIQANTDAVHAQWFEINEIPSLAFDHAEILKLAYKRLQTKLSYEPIGFDLLPKEFLFSELENLYCNILQKEIDRRNFRKKILSFGIVEETKKFGSKKNGRPAKLYKFNKLKYNKLLKEGFLFEIHFA